MQEINVIELFKISPSGKIIDVREVFEFEKSHIGGSINIPLSLIFDKYHLFLNKQNTYYIICKNGIKSRAVVVFLRQRGYNAIYVVGGLDEWPGLFSHNKYY